MIFSELYSTYYNTVAKILQQAIKTPLSNTDIWSIVKETAFSESILNIPDDLKNENWQLLKSDGSTIIKNMPKMPLTVLQKRWLKSIFNDVRIKLFTDFTCDFPEVEPLFLPEDFYIFDKYSDGDDFANENYIKNFRLVLDAIKNKFCLKVVLQNRKCETQEKVVSPCKLEYSEKDDKFRVVCVKKGESFLINLGRIVECEKAPDYCVYCTSPIVEQTKEFVIFELFDTRKALERAMLHFAHFEKQAESIGDNKYKIKLFYDKNDETELLIRVLSFGPMVKVCEPESFVAQVKERLHLQKELQNINK